MTVPLDRILQKLTDQVALAKQHQQNPELFKQYISRAQMLCELMIEEPNEEKVQKNTIPNEPSVSENSQKAISIDETTLHQQSMKATDLPGDSIFDF